MSYVKNHYRCNLDLNVVAVRGKMLLGLGLYVLGSLDDM